MRIVSLAVNLPGPLACLQLVARGAQITRVEPPAGDLLRFASRAWYEALIAGQTVITLDLASADRRDELDGFLSAADVLITASRPATLQRFGLTYDLLHERFPSLCTVAIFGRSEDAQRAGHDLTYQAAAGTLDPPSMPRILAADVLGAQQTVSAVFEALLERERFGGGVHREVYLAQAALAAADSILYGLTTPDGVLGGESPFYQLYKAADGWIALAALEPQFRARTVAALGGPAETYAAFAAAFVRESCAHWETVARDHDVPLAKVRERPGA